MKLLYYESFEKGSIRGLEGKEIFGLTSVTGDEPNPNLIGPT
jgi:hypothetical protein